MYDTYECDRCGITGRRYGLVGPITPDRAYKAKVYIRCDTALEHLEKRGHPKAARRR